MGTASTQNALSFVKDAVTILRDNGGKMAMSKQHCLEELVCERYLRDA